MVTNKTNYYLVVLIACAIVLEICICYGNISSDSAIYMPEFVSNKADVNNRKDNISNRQILVDNESHSLFFQNFVDGIFDFFFGYGVDTRDLIDTPDPEIISDLKYSLAKNYIDKKKEEEKYSKSSLVKTGNKMKIVVDSPKHGYDKNRINEDILL